MNDPARPAADPFADREGPGPGPDQAAPEAAPDPLAALVAERDELKDRLLRALADVENMRRRSEREVAEARSFGIARFARDMLDVADNLRRALDSMPAEVPESLKALAEGVALTERDLLHKFDVHGIRKVEPAGERFDPNLHQAVYEAPHGAIPAGHVAQVVQVGYALQGRVLRPALVGVSKGPAAPEPVVPVESDGA